VHQRSRGLPSLRYIPAGDPCCWCVLVEPHLNTRDLSRQAAVDPIGLSQARREAAKMQEFVGVN